MENHGIYWHFDHVIPISKLNLEDKEELILCFQYLNYMPLEAKKKLKKKDNIVVSQIETHKKNIINFHKENNIEIDSEYLKLLARHLTMPGNSLEF